MKSNEEVQTTIFSLKLRGYSQVRIAKELTENVRKTAPSTVNRVIKGLEPNEVVQKFITDLLIRPVADFKGK